MSLNRRRALLSPQQTAALAHMARGPLARRFTLTGGTALSAVYLGHRYSEDLDFFATEEFDPLILSGFITAMVRAGFEARRESRMNRQLLHLVRGRSMRLRVEFVYFPFEPIQPPIPWRGLRADSLLDIAVNKVHAAATRTEPKDLVDLYAILKVRNDFTLRRLLAFVRTKFDAAVDPLALAERLMRVEEIRLLPRMATPLSRSALRRFCLDQARLLARGR